MNIHSICGEIANLIIKAAALHESADNLTAMVVAFKGLYDFVNSEYL